MKRIRRTQIAVCLAAAGVGGVFLLNFTTAAPDGRTSLEKGAAGKKLKLDPEQPDAESLIDLGEQAWEHGDLKSARGYFERALEIRQELQPDSVLVAKTLNLLGTLAWFDPSASIQEADSYWRRALAILERRAPDSLDMGSSLNDVGLVAWRLFDYELAADYLSRSMAILETKAPGSLHMATVLNNLGNLASGRGELEQAEHYHRQALAIRKELCPGAPSVALSLHHLGKIAMDRGELDLAEDYYTRALALRQRRHNNYGDLAHSFTSLGALAEAGEKLEMAESYFHRALDLQGGKSITLRVSLSHLGAIAEKRGHLEKAEEYYKKSFENCTELAPDSVCEARSLRALGNLFRKTRRTRLATDSYRRAIAALEGQIGKLGGSHELKAGYRARHGHIYRELIELLLQQSSPAQAFHILERSRAGSLLAMIAERQLTFRSRVPEELERARRGVTERYDRIQRQIWELDKKDLENQHEVLFTKLRELRIEYNEIADEIRRESPKFANLLYPQPLKVQDVLGILDAGTTLLSYSVGNEQTDLFVVRPKGGVRVATLGFGEEDLRHRVKELRNMTLTARPGDETGARRSFTTIGGRLYKALIEPVADEVAESDRVLIIPDGPLHLLPWGALIRESPETRDADGRSWQYLAEWKPLHVALSATVYAELKRQRDVDRGKSAAPIRFAAFGDPAYPGDLAAGSRDGIADVRLRSAVERGMFDWSPLPDTRREVEQISSLFPQGTARIHLGRDATEEAAKAIDSGTRVVHFATHGHLDDRFPLNSALVLTIPERFSDGRDNGYLQVWEIFERVRLDADLVVLSACSSALGKEQAGEGLIGLTRAFQYAGARSVVASLWNVRDQATAELMVRFYRHLSAGKPKDEALRAAQIELIRGPVRVPDDEGRLVERDFSAPYYWAAFQVYGDPL